MVIGPPKLVSGQKTLFGFFAWLHVWEGRSLYLFMFVRCVPLHITAGQRAFCLAVQDIQGRRRNSQWMHKCPMEWKSCMFVKISEVSAHCLQRIINQSPLFSLSSVQPIVQNWKTLKHNVSIVWLINQVIVAALFVCRLQEVVQPVQVFGLFRCTDVRLGKNQQPRQLSVFQVARLKKINMKLFEFVSVFLFLNSGHGQWYFTRWHVAGADG